MKLLRILVASWGLLWLFGCWSSPPAMAAPVSPYPMTVDVQRAKAPAIWTHQANGRTFEVRFQDGGTNVNVTGRGPQMAWFTDAYATAQVLASSNVTDAANGLVEFTFTEANLNTNGNFRYEVSLDDGVFVTIKQGDFRIYPSPPAAGVAALAMQDTYYRVTGDTLEGNMNGGGNSITNATFVGALTGTATNATAIDSIAVDLPATPTDEHVLTYDTAVGVWTSKAAAGAAWTADAAGANATNINWLAASNVVSGIVLVHPNGQYNIYEPAADTDVSRGLALSNAFTAVTNDTTLIIPGPATYHIEGFWEGTWWTSVPAGRDGGLLLDGVTNASIVGVGRPILETDETGCHMILKDCENLLLEGFDLQSNDPEVLDTTEKLYGAIMWTDTNGGTLKQGHTYRNLRFLSVGNHGIVSHYNWRNGYGLTNNVYQNLYFDSLGDAAIESDPTKVDGTCIVFFSGDVIDGIYACNHTRTLETGGGTNTEWTSEVTIRNVTSVNCLDGSFVIFGPTSGTDLGHRNYTVENWSEINHGQTDGSGVDAFVWQGRSFENWIVRNINFVNDEGRASIFLQPSSGATNMIFENIAGWTDFAESHANHLIWLDQTNTTENITNIVIRNCTAMDNREEAFVIEGGAIHLEGLYVENAGAGTDNPGIRVADGAVGTRDVKIYNSVMANGPGLEHMNDGIVIDAGVDNTYIDNVAFNNIKSDGDNVTDNGTGTTFGRRYDTDTAEFAIGGVSAGASSIRIYEDTDDGVNSTTIKVQAQSSNVTYTLPADDGDAGEQLQTDGAGALTWEAAGGGGSGDSIEVEDGDNAGTFSTIDTTARFEDSVDINFALVDGGAGGPDEITGTIRADSVALTTDTTGNYIGDISGSGFDTAITGASGEGVTKSVTFPRTATLAGNPGIGANVAVIGQNGILFEGSVGDTIEGLLQPGAITSTDKTWTLPDLTGTIILDAGAQTFTGIKTINADWVNTANPWADAEVADTLTIGAGSTVAGDAITDNTIDTSELESNSINTSNIVADAVTAAKIGADQIGESELDEALDFTATGDWNFISGQISYRVRTFTTATNRTWTLPEVGGAVVFVTGTSTQNLPNVNNSGYNVVFQAVGAVTVTVNPDNSDYITLNGTQAAAGEAIVSSGTAGDQISIISNNTTNWMTIGRIGTWVEETP